MPTAIVVRKNILKKSFRVDSIIDRHELDPSTADFNLNATLDYDNKQWSIGVICGSSGSGKSSLAKELYGNKVITKYDYGDNAIIDEMSKEKCIDEISRVFNSVGFGTIWNWLKPYNVLSNGEQMRVDLARSILENNKLIIFDEFTSVIDRKVAKVASFSISKAIRKENKQFVAVTCHRDIIEWLEPDWIYDTDERRFFFAKNLIQDQSYQLKLENVAETYGSVLKTCTI